MFKKLISFLERLSSKPRVGGLQITDSAIEYVLLSGLKTVNFAVRLPPGVLRQGRLENQGEFLRALQNLHSLIAPLRPNEILKAIVVMPAEVIYTQSFSVPNINREKLKESSRLNLQMISPIAAPNVYMSYQVIDETQDKFDLLGAFVEKSLTDEYRNILSAARFESIVFEFPALALSRVVNRAVGEVKEPLMVLQISSDGLDIFLFKGNSLHFDYFRSWQSIQGDAREISRAVFEGVIVEEVRKVINFALSRFKEEPKQALLIMPGFETEIKQLLEGRFGLKAAPLTLGSYALGPNWYGALGAAMRGILSAERDEYIVLGTEAGALNVFYEERILNFVRLWRNILTGVLGFFLAVFMISAAYLVSETKSLQGQLANISVRSSAQELEDLENKAQEFNGLVQAVEQAKGAAPAWSDYFKELTDLANANKVVINQFAITSLQGPITLMAQAPDHDTVLKFKNVLAAQPNFRDIDLPLSEVITQPDNSISFKITFRYAPAK